MQDSNLKYYILVEGAKEGAAAFKLVGDAAKQAESAVSGTGKSASGANKSIKDLNQTTDENANATNRASKAQSNYFVHIAKTTVQSALVNKAFLSMVDAMGNAVKQADLIENFPAIMGALGLSTADASVGLEKLRGYVQSVGGDLNAAASSVQRFVGINKNIQASVAMYAGLNNALIAGTSNTELQASALEQITQAYSRGRFEGEEWKSMMVAMASPISQVAKELGYISPEGLRNALSEGKISMNEFITELTKLSTGTGPIAQQAIAQMNGIQFAQKAMANALTNGLTSIYQAVGRQNIIDFFNFLTQVIGTLFTWVVQLINVFRWLFSLLTGTDMPKVTGDTAANLAAGAGNAADMGKELDDAGKSAKKLRNQLASFDKMNVLTEPKDDSDKNKGSSGPFDAAQAAALGDIFGDLSTDVQEVSMWAKILAGIIAGIIGLSATKAIIDWLSGIGGALKTAWEWGGKLWSSLSTIAKWAWGNVVDGANLLGAYLKNAWDRAKELASIAWEKFKQGVSDIVEKTKELAKTAWDGIKSGWEKVRDAAAATATKVKDVAKQMVITAATAVKQAAIAAAAWVKSAVTSAAAWIAQTAVMIAQFVLTTVRAIAQAIMVGAAWVAAAVATAAAWVIANAAMLGIWGLIIAAVIGAVALIVANWDGIVNFFKGVWNAIVGAIKAVIDWVVKNWPLLLAIITGPIGMAVLFIVQNWETIKQAFAAAWEFIKKIFAVVAGWINDTVVKPVLGFFSGLWDGIKKVFSVVGSWFSNIFQAGVDAIKRVFGAVGSWFGGIWDGIKNIFKNVGSWFGDTFGKVKDAITAPFKTAFNWVADMWNNTLGSIKWKAPDWVPVIGGKEIGFPKMPKLATGGVVNQSTIAEIGENGAEVVMPLENNTEWMDMLASRLNNSSSNSNRTPDIIPVTNSKDQPPVNIKVDVSGVLATSEQDKMRLAQMIAKQLEASLRAKGLKGAF